MKILGQNKSEMSTVPNSKGTVMTYDSATKTIGTRTHNEIVNDLGVPSLHAYNQWTQDNLFKTGITLNDMWTSMNYRIEASQGFVSIKSEAFASTPIFEVDGTVIRNAAYTFTLPTQDGTLALVSDITTAMGDYIPKKTTYLNGAPSNFNALFGDNVNGMYNPWVLGPGVKYVDTPMLMMGSNKGNSQMQINTDGEMSYRGGVFGNGYGQWRTAWDNGNLMNPATQTDLGNYVPLVGTTQFTGALENPNGSVLFGKKGKYKQIFINDNANPDFPDLEYMLYSNIEEGLGLVHNNIVNNLYLTLEVNMSQFRCAHNNGIEESELIHDGTGLFNGFYKIPQNDNYYVQKKYVHDTFVTNTQLGDYVDKTTQQLDIHGKKGFVSGIESANYNWYGMTTTPVGIVSIESSFYNIGAGYGYGISTNVHGGLDIMSNQSNQPIRFWSGGDNTNPIQTATFNGKDASFYGNIYTTNYGDAQQWYQAYQWGNHATQGYLTSASLNGYVPYTGATTDVDLGTRRIKAEGVAIGAIPNTLRITKQLGDTIGVLSESNGWGKIFAANYIVDGGTSSHFLKGDGSLDNDTYATQTWVQNNYGNGIQLNTEFTTITSNSLAITDDHIGDESGLTDTGNKKLIAGVREDHYKYGSTFNAYEGVNIHKTSSIVGIGMYANLDKLEVKGNISVDTGNGQLIVNPATNTDGDLSFIRNAHVYCATDVNVKLPIEPIEGQRFVIHNTGASFIIIETNLGNSTKLNERMKMELIYLGGKYLIDGSAQSFYEL